MYSITRTIRGNKVIERHETPTKMTNLVRTIFKNVFSQEAMLYAITVILGSWFVLEYLTGA